MGREHRLQHHHGDHRAQSTTDDHVSYLDIGLCHVCMGVLDEEELWHAGELSLIGIYRLCGLDQDAAALESVGNRIVEHQTCEIIVEAD